ncbi:N-acetylglucosamine kinase [Psychromonas sp. psych-6C06]|uniref:N-acetylglucosamine kinase n=1 Tax=Psychromonas sp. psych-6C06 TaxID=2058089 RepID=UPI000C3365BC|nr:N-acetylglucosamine kinase [Psychromonas sp. psych-6C06]PKF62846.1 N-acetylglucosamine kinase [Psychromonas sp. psych-6C06]
MTEWTVGIDGGGTSCRARICNAKGEVLSDAKTGSANILLGVQVAMDSIIEAILLASRQAGLTESHFKDMHVGLALAGAEQKSAWLEFMKLPHPFASLTLNTDAYGACLGAHNGADGAIMIAGTGSCGILIKEGEQYIVGGREFPISDQGGGAVTGLRLIQHVLLAYDGIKARTELVDHVLDHFNNDLDQIVDWSKSARPCDYGQFSPAIFKYAKAGDRVAVNLLKQCAEDIDMFLLALHKRGANKIALMGSIGERIVDWLEPTVREWLVQPQGDAMNGALMMAGNPEHNLY